MLSVPNSITIGLYFIDGYRSFVRNYTLITAIYGEEVFLRLILNRSLKKSLYRVCIYPLRNAVEMIGIFWCVKIIKECPRQDSNLLPPD